MLVEGRHFLPGAEPRALGHKALAVNLSDLAAMGATPRWATLALALPAAEPAWLEAFSAGFFALAERYGVDLVGGDTTRGAAAHHQHHRDRRGAARAWRSSAPARARATTSGFRASSAARRSALAHPGDRRRRRSACTRPSRASSSASACAASRTPRSTCPTASPATSATSSSARRSARWWNTSAFRDRRAFEALNDPELERDCVLSGGDDYELAFTAPRDAARASSRRSRASCKLALTRIGAIAGRRRRGSRCSTPQGKPLAHRGGFDHFATADDRRCARGPRFAFSHPAHVVAFGFGAGLAPFAPGHRRHAARLGARLGARRACTPGLRARSTAVLFFARRLGLRGHRPPPRRRRPRRDGVGRGRRVPARCSPSCRASSPGRRPAFVAVPLLRHRQAAADPLLRAALRRRLRRDVRRPGRRGATRCWCSPRSSGCSSDGGAGEAGRRAPEGARAAMLVTAESCTGGWVAQAVTSVAGSSAWFERGFVTYSNAAKQELLGVQERDPEAPRRGERGNRARDGARRARAQPGHASRWRSPASPARRAAARESRSAWCASPGPAPARCAARRGTFRATGRACGGNRLSTRSKGS